MGIMTLQIVTVTNFFRKASALLWVLVAANIMGSTQILVDITSFWCTGTNIIVCAATELVNLTRHLDEFGHTGKPFLTMVILVVPTTFLVNCTKILVLWTIHLVNLTIYIFWFNCHCCHFNQFVDYWNIFFLVSAARLLVITTSQMWFLHSSHT